MTPTDAIALRAAARLLLWVFRLGTVAALVELLFLEHYEHFWQRLPLVLLSGALFVSFVVARWTSATALRLWTATCAALVLGGVAGLVLHHQNNVAFLLEMQPHLAGWPLFWEALHGAVPALAPGTLIYLGVLGMVYTRLFRSSPGDSSRSRSHPVG